MDAAVRRIAPGSRPRDLHARNRRLPAGTCMVLRPWSCPSVQYVIVLILRRAIRQAVDMGQTARESRKGREYREYRFRVAEQLRHSRNSRPLRIVILQNAVSGPFEVVELPVSQRPPEHP